jgi:hypothetical protein
MAADFASSDNNGGPKFGIVLRYQNATNYYLISRTTGGASQLRVSRFVNGAETILDRVHQQSGKECLLPPGGNGGRNSDQVEARRCSKGVGPGLNLLRWLSRAAGSDTVGGHFAPRR